MDGKTLRDIQKRREVFCVELFKIEERVREEGNAAIHDDVEYQYRRSNGIRSAPQQLLEAANLLQQARLLIYSRG